ncbi:MAG: 2-phosphosulfolactate phosphatase [Bacteroidales bacterium 45-6]|nr:MAG: 2-phosphosulfolactate phosphatase [Bacteroidales bacterium 45-6]
MKVDVCFSPALYPYYHVDNDNTIVVVVDIFRATTTMCAAFKNGVKSVIPVASIEEAEAYKAKGYLVGAERNVKRCDFADFGNSPFDYTAEKVAGKEIVFTTTNGTQAIETAAGCYRLAIGAFSNISALAEYCNQQGKDVMILCSGWNNRFNMEDSLFAGALAFLLNEKGVELASDAAKVACDMWMQAKPNIRAYIDRTEHIRRLTSNHLADSVEYCLAFDTVSLVPIYDKEKKAIYL